MELEKSEELAASLASLNIGDEELAQVIREGEEKGGQKFHHPATGRFLAHKRIGEASYYVVYSGKNGRYTIHAAYWHKSELI